jgi:hypothetical protein
MATHSEIYKQHLRAGILLVIGLVGIWRMKKVLGKPNRKIKQTNANEPALYDLQ